MIEGVCGVVTQLADGVGGVEGLTEGERTQLGQGTQVDEILRLRKGYVTDVSSTHSNMSI